MSYAQELVPKSNDVRLVLCVNFLESGVPQPEPTLWRKISRLEMAVIMMSRKVIREK